MYIKAAIIEQLKHDGTIKNIELKSFGKEDEIVVALVDEYNDYRDGPFHYMDLKYEKQYQKKMKRAKSKRIGSEYFQQNQDEYIFKTQWKNIPTEQGKISYYALCLPEYAIPVEIKFVDPLYGEKNYRFSVKKDKSNNTFIIYLECKSKFGLFNFLLNLKYKIDRNMFSEYVFTDENLVQAYNNIEMPNLNDYVTSKVLSVQDTNEEIKRCKMNKINIIMTCLEEKSNTSILSKLKNYKNSVLQSIKLKKDNKKLHYENKYINYEHPDQYLDDLDYKYYYMPEAGLVQKVFSNIGVNISQPSRARDVESHSYFYYYLDSQVIDCFEKLDVVKFYCATLCFIEIMDGNCGYFFEDFYNTIKEYIEKWELVRIISEYMDDNKVKEISKKECEIEMKRVFVVHGHDNEAKEKMARTLEKVALEPIILHEQASGGKTIIEKIEEYSDVEYGIVLYTPCDIGRRNNEQRNKERNRARQNVVFEHGYLIAKLGREKVCAIVKDDTETPGDISGIVYIVMDDAGGWKSKVADEMIKAGIQIDKNKL